MRAVPKELSPLFEEFLRNWPGISCLVCDEQRISWRFGEAWHFVLRDQQDLEYVTKDDSADELWENWLAFLNDFYKESNNDGNAQEHNPEQPDP